MMTLNDIRARLIGRTMRIDFRYDGVIRKCQRLTLSSITSIPKDKDNVIVNRGLNDEDIMIRDVLEALALTGRMTLSWKRDKVDMSYVLE